MTTGFRTTIPVPGNRTAGPKAGRLMEAREVLTADLPLQALLEALDLAGGVDDVLRAREERVAVAAHVHAQLRSRGPDGPLGAARAAMDLGFVILGMDLGLHGCLSSDAVRAGPSPRRWSPAVCCVSGRPRRSSRRSRPPRPGCASCPWWRART